MRIGGNEEAIVSTDTSLEQLGGNVRQTGFSLVCKTISQQYFVVESLYKICFFFSGRRSLQSIAYKIPPVKITNFLVG